MWSNQKWVTRLARGQQAIDWYKTKEIQTSEHSMFDLGFNDAARMWVGSKGDESTPVS